MYRQKQHHESHCKTGRLSTCEKIPNHDTCKVYVIRPASWGCHCLWDAEGLLPLSLSEQTGIFSVIGALHIILFLLSTNVVHHHYMQEEDNCPITTTHMEGISCFPLCSKHLWWLHVYKTYGSKYHGEMHTWNWHNKPLWQFACRTLFNVSSFTKKYHCYFIVFYLQRQYRRRKG